MFLLKFSKITSAGLALIYIFAGCESGASRGGGSAIHSDAHYAFLFGQRYRTRVGLYVFSFTRDPDSQFVGTRADNSNFGPAGLPAVVDAKNVGKLYERRPQDALGDLIILDVAPAGSILTVRAETHDVTPLSGVREAGGYPMGFICELDFGGKTNTIFSEFIQSHKKVSGQVPNQDISRAVAAKIR